MSRYADPSLSRDALLVPPMLTTRAPWSRGLFAPLRAEPRVEERIRAELAAVVDLVYGHDFERADSAAAALETRHPGHPAGPLLKAVAEYQRWVASGLREDGSLSYQVAGEEDLERELRDLARLEREPTEADPDPGTVDGAVTRRQQGWEYEQPEAYRHRGVGQ